MATPQITITATRAVWMNAYHTPNEVLQYIERGDFGRVVDVLSLYGPTEMEKFGDGYTRMGEAEVTIRLLPRDEMTKQAVQALNAKLDDLRAKYMQAQQEILDRIQSLQAIEYVQEQS